MIRLVLAALAGACVFAGWTNLPRLENPSSGAAGMLLGGVVLLAYFMGRRSVSAEATATAIASARAAAASAAHAGATAHSQVVVVTGGEGARAVAERTYGAPSWIGGRLTDMEQLQGSDAMQSVVDDLQGEFQHEDG